MKLLFSLTAWMPASAGMTNKDTVSDGGGEGGGVFLAVKIVFIRVHPRPIKSLALGSLAIKKSVSICTTVLQDL